MKNKKEFEKIREKMKKYVSGDGDELINSPIPKSIGSVLSLGKAKGLKSSVRSSKKRIGNIVNKDINKRYNGVEKQLNRLKKRKEGIK